MNMTNPAQPSQRGPRSRWRLVLGGLLLTVAPAATALTDLLLPNSPFSQICLLLLAFSGFALIIASRATTPGGGDSDGSTDGGD